MECYSDMLRRRKSPARSQRKGGAKGSVALLKESIQLVVWLKILIRGKSIPREKGKIGNKTRRQILQGHLAPNEKIGKERVRCKELFKSVNLMSVVFARQNSGKIT